MASMRNCFIKSTVDITPVNGWPLHVNSSGNENRRAMKYWEIIADNLKKAGWSLGYVSAVDSQGRTIWIADAHRNGKRFVVRADEKLTAFMELEAPIRRGSGETLHDN
jgi:hypothetical protein